MSLATLPLLIAALFMLGSGGTPPGTVELLLSGQVTLAGPPAGEPAGRTSVSGSDPSSADPATPDQRAVIVGEALAHVPAGAEVPGPIHVIGGSLRVDGRVAGDVVQLAGTVVVGPDASIGGELRHVAGSLVVDQGADISRRSTLELTSESGDGPRSFAVSAVLTLLLALAGGFLTRTRPRALDNVADAVTSHPVIVLTVGALLGLTGIAVIVYMGFTLVLLPVALIALGVGALALATGTIGVGHAVGRRIPWVSPPVATAVGVVSTVVVLRLVGLVPLVGGLTAGAVLLSGLGATILTYFGLTRFEPVRIPE
jgi:hypothetical protein